jgi:hypothetical protein
MACESHASLNIAATGSTFSALPFIQSNPDGLFIQALADTTKMPDITPEMPTMTPGSPVYPLVQPVPAIQENANSYGFDKEGGSFP